MALNLVTETDRSQEPRILFVSDSASSARGLVDQMKTISADFAPSGAECCQKLRTTSYYAIFADFPLPDCSPNELLEEVQRVDSTLPVLIRDASGTVRDAVRLMKSGAAHFFGADIDSDEFAEHLDSARNSHSRSEEKAPGPAWRKFLVGSSGAMEPIFRIIDLVGQRRCTVLITGETGTGKEVVARAVHSSGPRSRLPMVTVNCAALPENLLEAELFGHVKGAFTGAANHRTGRFEQANGSTIFLDEIAEMPIELQAKLLRVLQERELQRLGSSETISVDLRIIAATNSDLGKRVDEGRFREDLFYRLNVVPIRIPPLRERAADIPALVDYLVKKICRAEDIPAKQVSHETLRRLTEYAWPGNVRQLENALEMAVALSGDRSVLAPGDFPLQGAPTKFSSGPAPSNPLYLTLPDHGLDFERTVAEFERNILLQALEKTSGNKKQAADMLGLKRTTLAAKLRILEEPSVSEDLQPKVA